MNILSIISTIHLLLFLLFNSARAQTSSNPRVMASPQDSATNFQPSLAVVIGMLAIMFALTFVLLLYAKFCHRAHSTSPQIRDGLARSLTAGLDKAAVESLPFFRFSSLRGTKDGLECSVCLAKFEDIEILRLLPKCRHAFHIDCIDQWLENNSTCPLCRRKVSAGDLSPSTSMRFLRGPSSDQSNIELYVEREENRHGSSSRFSVGCSFRKSEDKEEELRPIPPSMDCEEEPLHRFNHKIFVSDFVALKNRWSNVSSSDLIFLNSEMVNDVSSARFSSSDKRSTHGSNSNGQITMMNIREEMERKRAFESKVSQIKRFVDRNNPVQLPATSKVLNPDDKRSMSEIVVHPRFNELRNTDALMLEEERTRRLWLPIARKTLQWFANRERRPPESLGLNV